MPSPSNSASSRTPSYGRSEDGATDEEALHCQRRNWPRPSLRHEAWGAIGETESVASMVHCRREHTEAQFQSDRCRRRHVASHGQGVRAGGTMAHRKIVAAMFGMASGERGKADPS